MGNHCSFSAKKEETINDVIDPSGSCINDKSTHGNKHTTKTDDKKAAIESEKEKTKLLCEKNGVLGGCAGTGNLNVCNDSIVNSVVGSFIERSNLGQLKYGTTLDRDDLTMNQWIQHMQEELMDAILYLEKIKSEKTKMDGDQIDDLRFCIAQPKMGEPPILSMNHFDSMEEMESKTLLKDRWFPDECEL
jgi:hypothetical protein